ncbi:MAG TPA: rod shape-determining protein MreC [Acidobacteriaceae bacterium]|nr:rod shape-determining protein MreC [Acidobacteriaceae bacterium]
MDSFFARFKNPLVLVAVVLLQTIGLAVQVQRGSGPGGDPADGAKISQLRYWSTLLVTPFERVLHGGGSHVRSVWVNYLYLLHTRQQNIALQNEVARLREEQAAFAEDAEQGRRVQALLGFQHQYIAKTVAAQVVGTSGSDRSRLLLIDKGSKDGLKPDQAVITPDGIVGKLRDVWAHSAQLLLINDSTSGAGVILESTRIRGIIRGAANGKVEINNLTSDSRIKPGEHVITSGGDGVFPRGLPVGVIESIAPDPEHQPYTAIMIKPAADLARLEEVLVVTGTQTTLPPQAQQDEDMAAATANAKRAADLAADKLPSIHDGEPAAGPNAAGASAAGATPAAPVVPRPLPALHPDRYTPGVTPPAADLTPGAPKGSSSPAAAPHPPESDASPKPQT